MPVAVYICIHAKPRLWFTRLRLPTLPQVEHSAAGLINSL
jgi:hypothetical protein